MRQIPLRQAIAHTLWVLAGVPLLVVASCPSCDGNPQEDMQSSPDAGGSSVDSGMESPSGTLTISFQPIDGPGTTEDAKAIPELLAFNINGQERSAPCPYMNEKWTCVPKIADGDFIEIVPMKNDNWEFVEWFIPSCYRMKKCQFYWDSNEAAQTKQLAVSFKYIKEQSHIWPSSVRFLHQDWAYADPSIFSLDGKNYIHTRDTDKYVHAFASAGGMPPSVWLATEGGFLLNCRSHDCVIDGRSYRVSEKNLLGLSIDAASSRIWIAGVAGYLASADTKPPFITPTPLQNTPKTTNFNAVWGTTWGKTPWAVAVGDRSTIQVVKDDKVLTANTGCVDEHQPTVWRAVAGPDLPDASATSLDVWAVAASGKICKVTLSRSSDIGYTRILPPMGYEEADINAVSVIKRGEHTEVWALVYTPPLDTGPPRDNYLLKIGINPSMNPIKIRDSSDTPLTALWIDATNSFAYAAGKGGIHRIRLPDRN